MKTQTHTPGRISILPWHTEGPKIVDNSGYYVTQMSQHGKSYDSEMEDAAFIVRACNSHDELLEACKAIVQDLENNGELFGTDQKRIDYLNNIIAKSEGR